MDIAKIAVRHSLSRSAFRFFRKFQQTVKVACGRLKISQSAMGAAQIATDLFFFRSMLKARNVANCAPCSCTCFLGDRLHIGEFAILLYT